MGESSSLLRRKYGFGATDREPSVRLCAARLALLNTFVLTVGDDAVSIPYPAQRVLAFLAPR
jgi:hypothetical protein